MIEDKEIVFKKLDKHLMEDKRPSIYFKSFLEKGEFIKEYPLKLLYDMTNVPQDSLHHPEGSVWNHTMLVIDNAADKKKLSEDPHVFMWAALLHDIGKREATKIRKGKITAYDHDKYGEEIAREFLEEFNCDKEFVHKVSCLVRWHMQTLFVVKNMPFADIEKMASQVSIDEVGLLSLCDRLGRGNITLEKYKVEENNVKEFLKKSKNFCKTKKEKMKK